MDGGGAKGSRSGTVGRREFLAFVCLGIAPIVGVWLGSKLPNPPGRGPGGWQVVVGVGLPAGVALAAATVARVRRLEAALWVLAALVATAGLLLFLEWLVGSID